MLKKIVTIALSAALVLSALGVSAEVINKDSGMIVYTDDFDSATPGDYNKFDGTGSSLPSDVFSAPNTTIASGYGQIMQDPRNANNQVFQAYSTTGDEYLKRSLYTIPLTTLGTNDDSTWYAFSYDFKVDRTIANIYIAHELFRLSNDGNIYNTIDNDSRGKNANFGAYAADTWYHVEMIAYGNTMQGWIYDDSGEVIAESTTSTYSQEVTFEGSVTTSAEKKLCAYAVSAGSGNNRGVLITLDNAKLAVYNPEEVNPSGEASFSNNATGVQRNVVLSFDFDQDVSFATGYNGSNAVTMKTIDNPATTDLVEEETNVVGVTCTLNGRTLTVSYNGLLERNTTYEVSFPGVINTKGLQGTTYTFTTEDLHLWDPVTDIEIGTPGADTTPITFTIGDEYGYPTFDGEVLVLVYQGGEMIAYDMQDLTVTLTEGEGTGTVNFAGAVPAGAEVCVVLLDCVNGPIPLASGTTTN